MKKLIRITLISLGTLVLILGILALAMFLTTRFYTDGSDLPSEQNGLALDNWMSAIRDDAKMCEIAMPGAHDAGCIDMMWAYQTQNKTIAEQLTMGVRYFDLRTANDEGTLKIYHESFIGVELAPILDAISSFLEQNPTEALLLDFQHFYDEDAIDATKNALQQTLGGKVVRNDKGVDDVTFVNSLTLAETRGKCVVFWGSVQGSADSDWLFLRDNDDGTRTGASLHSYYKREYNTQPSKTYIAECLPLYIEQFRQSNGGIFVLQGQLTDKLYVFGPAIHEVLHARNMNSYLGGLDDETVKTVNVVMRDYVTPQKSMITIILNLKKENVKTEYAAVLNAWSEK